LGLNPTGRQLDLSLGYTRDLSKKDDNLKRIFTVTKDVGHKKIIKAKWVALFLA
jgi:hypothetical protein